MGFTDHVFFDTIMAMQYAVIETGGKQYKITKGQVLDVDSLNLEAGENVNFDKVLLVVSDGAVDVGAPYLANAAVSAKVVESLKGDKLRISRFKAKTRNRKVTGFRPKLTKVEISDIKVGSSSQKEAKKATSK